jgi:hypothetical protein
MTDVLASTARTETEKPSRDDLELFWGAGSGQCWGLKQREQAHLIHLTCHSSLAHEALNYVTASTQAASSKWRDFESRRVAWAC